MNGSTFLLVVTLGSALTWFVRDRHVRGWRRPLYRKRGYDVAAAARGDATKGHLGMNVPGVAPGADFSGGMGGGPSF